MHDRNKYPVLRADILNASLEPPGALLFDPENETGFIVDGLAARLCILFTGRLTLGEAIAVVAAESATPEAEFSEELGVFLGNLDAQELVRWLDKPLNS